MRELKVAVLNTSKEITEMLAEVLKDEGFDTCTDFTYHFKKQEDVFDDFVKQNRPEIILYDIAPPYKENYDLFKKLYTRNSVESIPFVLTTTNKEALESMVGPTATYELIGKPYDLQEIVDALRAAYTKKEKHSPDYSIMMRKSYLRMIYSTLLLQEMY